MKDKIATAVLIADNAKRCTTCVNSRAVTSENGVKYICCLPRKLAIKCLTLKKDSYDGLDNDLYRKGE